MNQFKITALALAASLALFPSLGFAQQPPSAYSGGSQASVLVPNYYLLQGSYAKTLSSGTMAAGLGAAAPVFSLRYTPTVTGSIAVIKRVTLTASAGGTAFTAGTAQFSLFAARAFTASDSGGTAATLTGNNGKLRTSFATTSMGDIRIASTATLTAGTRTLDTDALAGFLVFVPPTSTNYALVAPNSLLFDPKNAGDTPLMLANNEGFVVEATVPATGTWDFSIFVEWDEYSQY